METTTIFLLCSSLLSFLIISSVADTLTAGQTISDGETIVSASEEFEMGFFSPRRSPQNQYFGIWYKKISTGTVVWVANRETPIINNTGILSVNGKGIMVSINESSDTIIWSSNYSTSVKNPVAQLLDTGNLVFRDANEDENFIWQSFDYPVDNILPTMKFGLVNGINKHLISWKSDEDPSAGNYIYGLDLNGYPQLIVWKDSVVWFRSGPWVGTRFSGVATLETNGIYTFDYVVTQTDIYDIFNLVNTSESVTTRFTLTPTGDLQRMLWNRQKQEWTIYLTIQVSDCDNYGHCGGYGVCNTNKSPRCECMTGFNPKFPEDWAAADWSNGCTRNVKLNCGNGDGFLKYSGIKLPDTRRSWYNTSMNLDECKSLCLKNCSCTAYSNTDVRNGGSGCLLWFTDLIDIKGYSEHAEDLYVRMAASELNSSRTDGNKNSSKKKHLLLLLIPLFVVLIVLLGLFLLSKFKNRWLNRKGVVQLNQRGQLLDATNNTASGDLDLPLFDFIHIANATNNFSSDNKLGEGGFGSVYKGILEDGQNIAVKRLSKDSRQGVVEFMNEVSCIAKLQHRNLVRLLGCCVDEGERI